MAKARAKAKASMTKSTPTKGRRRDPEAERLATLERIVERAAGRTGAAEWDAGKTLDEIVVSNLYARVAPTVQEYVERRFPALGYTTLKRYRAVARRFPRRAARHGMYRLWLGLQHIDATPADEKPADLLRMDIELADGTRKAFLRCTPEEIEAATRALRRPDDESAIEHVSDLPRGATPRIERVRSELAKGFTATVERPTIHAHVVGRGKKRVVALTLRGVMLDTLGIVGRALVRASSPS
ncbi:MAG: hypothetical protein IT379_27065 [Deltaproteobacteria bacterium]|nr:hypothetical protein [Deltaproteobacteria bacterium]